MVLFLQLSLSSCVVRKLGQVLTIISYASPFSVYTDYIYTYVKNVHRLSLRRHGVAG